MAQVLVRNLDDDLVAAYREAAGRNGRSFEAELREGLARGRPRRPSRREELRQLSSELRAMTPHEPPQGDSTQIIRWFRDTHGGRWTDDGWSCA